MKMEAAATWHRRTNAGTLNAPPPAEAKASFPAEFGRRFAIFGDAEEEFDWHAPFDRGNTSTLAIASLPAANRRFTGFGAIPTYLVDYPVVDNCASAGALRAMYEAGECDIGAQLHPWVTPPHEEAVNLANSYAGALPLALERAKIRMLTDKLREAFGCDPIAYRAGRYGIGPNTAHLLGEAGYRLDVSVRPLFDYRGQGGPDFTAYPIWPYWVSEDLLEVPLTTSLAGPLVSYPALTRLDWLRGGLARARLLNRVSLTPEDVPLAEAIAAIEILLDTDTRLFSLSFHTPSVEPGHTPYVSDEADLRTFWAWWNGVLNLFAKHGVTPVRSGEILAAAERG